MVGVESLKQVGLRALLMGKGWHDEANEASCRDFLSATGKLLGDKFK
jgi:hypothetical protein